MFFFLFCSKCFCVFVFSSSHMQARILKNETPGFFPCSVLEFDVAQAGTYWLVLEVT